MIDHRKIAAEISEVCQRNGLTGEEPVKVLIYTATKMMGVILKDSNGNPLADEPAAEALVMAVKHFRKEIQRAERMFKNRG